MEEPTPILKIAESYLQTFVAPQANALDHEPALLHSALKGLGERHLLALRVPQPGLPAVREETFRRLQILITRYSGALSFLQSQHQSASSLLAKCENEALKTEFLPYLPTGEKLIGIGFSQLRRRGDPVITATPAPDGYHLNGWVPWITGFDYFEHFILGATLPDGGALYGVVPFQDACEKQGTISFSKPLPLAVMSATNTVTAQLTDWFLPHSQVVMTKPAGWIHENDKRNVLHHSFFALGCARAALDIVQAAGMEKQLPFISQAYQTLDNQLTTCQEAIIQFCQQPEPSESQTPPTLYNRLKLRAQAIELASRCATAAITVSSGAANLPSSAAQRVYREALVFTVSGQTTDVMEATLALLTGN